MVTLSLLLLINSTSVPETIDGTIEINAIILSAVESYQVVDSRLSVSSTTYTFGQDVLSITDNTNTENSILFLMSNYDVNWDGYAIQPNSLIIDIADLDLLTNNALITYYDPLETKLKVNSMLMQANTVVTSREVNTTYKIFFDGEDVTHLISEAKISYSRDSYCGQLDITWKDWSYFTRLDCTNMVENHGRERFSVFINNLPFGNFLNEKRDVSTSFGETSPTSWGRTKTALLSQPYSLPVTPTTAISSGWLVDRMARDICTELAALQGISLRWEILDFKVRAGKFIMDSEYPIDGISRLASSVGGIVTTSRFSPELIVRYKWIV